MALEPIRKSFRAAMTGVAMLGSFALAYAGGENGPSSAYAQAQQRNGAAFTPEECVIVSRLLLGEMKRYRPVPGDPDSVITSTLPTSAMAFTGVDRNQFICKGSLNWSTRGEKCILDAVVVGIALLEDDNDAPKGLARKLNSVIPETRTVASNTPTPRKISAPAERPEIR